MTVAEPESLGYLDRLPSPFYSAIIYWYFIPLPFLYYIRFFFSNTPPEKYSRCCDWAYWERSGGGKRIDRWICQYQIRHGILWWAQSIPLRRCGGENKSPFRGSVSNLVEEAGQEI